MKWNFSLALIIAICLSQFLYGQESSKNSDPVTISGKVVNFRSEPVSGAVLYIDNIKTSVTTKSNGTYKIKVSPSAMNLEVRSSEFGTSIVAINGHTTINFLLEGGNGVPKIADTTIVPVVETTGKQHKPKKMNTYTSIYEMIRCEVSGVTVSGRTVQIQQAHSFFGSGTPLFVINGVIVQSIDNVNPMEVKSIGLLKGSSAAIYGVNGSNGVISITLKNGTEKEK
jgi:TonB-dependent starch-binding outer membrane protein SusC